MTSLKDPVLVRSALHALKLKLDGTAAAETVRRKKNTFVNALQYAIDLGELSENPVASVKWHKPRVVKEVDPRVVANPRQMNSILDACTYVGWYSRARGRRLVAFFGGIYFGAFRPAESAALAVSDLYLPDEGWGLANLHRTRPSAGRKWTDNGETHDDRGLKNRPVEEVRPVPIRPQLVTIYKWSIDTFGAADDGRVSFNERGGVVGSSTYDRVWHEARELALPPEQVNSPLAKRPYDARHSALTGWLNAGLDPVEVAGRAGNSVEVLLARYAK
ncbi:hypothetical protein [Streptomyces diastatochromogenes]|uniref:hypothetical protein n=1 Tax=Streptomyces diastatochromogenes TaxID=42236 RepID=UPI0036BCBA46